MPWRLPDEAVVPPVGGEGRRLDDRRGGSQVAPGGVSFCPWDRCYLLIPLLVCHDDTEYTPQTCQSVKYSLGPRPGGTGPPSPLVRGVPSICIARPRPPPPACPWGCQSGTLLQSSCQPCQCNMRAIATRAERAMRATVPKARHRSILYHCPIKPPGKNMTTHEWDIHAPS